MPSWTELGIGQLNVQAVRAELVGVAAPWVTPSSAHWKSSARLEVVEEKAMLVTPGLVIVGPAGFGTSVLTAGANALPGLLMTPCWRTLRVAPWSFQVTSMYTRL